MLRSQGPGRLPLLCGVGRGGKWPLLRVAEEAGEMASPSGQPALRGWRGWWVPGWGRVWGQGARRACFVLGPQREHCPFCKPLTLPQRQPVERELSVSGVWLSCDLCTSQV